MQFFTAILFFNDALAYIFRGCVGSLGYYMVRISNFMVFILSDVIMFFFHVYVCSYLFEDGEWKKIRRAKSVSYTCAIGVVLVIISQFTNFYYYFDADNFYHRNTGYIISLLIPVIAMFIDLTLLLQFRKNMPVMELCHRSIIYRQFQSMLYLYGWSLLRKTKFILYQI